LPRKAQPNTGSKLNAFPGNAMGRVKPATVQKASPKIKPSVAFKTRLKQTAAAIKTTSGLLN
jgi:hypothetical protein